MTCGKAQRFLVVCLLSLALVAAQNIFEHSSLGFELEQLLQPNATDEVISISEQLGGDDQGPSSNNNTDEASAAEGDEGATAMTNETMAEGDENDEGPTDMDEEEIPMDLATNATGMATGDANETATMEEPGDGDLDEEVEGLLNGINNTSLPESGAAAGGNETDLIPLEPPGEQDENDEEDEEGDTGSVFPGGNETGGDEPLNATNMEVPDEGGNMIGDGSGGEEPPEMDSDNMMDNSTDPNTAGPNGDSLLPVAGDNTTNGNVTGPPPVEGRTVTVTAGTVVKFDSLNGSPSESDLDTMTEAYKAFLIPLAETSPTSRKLLRASVRRLAEINPDSIEIYDVENVTCSAQASSRLLQNTDATTTADDNSTTTATPASNSEGAVSENPPSNGTAPDGDTCWKLSFQYELTLDESEDPEVVQQQWESATREAIDDGKLQEAVAEIDPEAGISIEGSTEPAPLPSPPSSTLAPTTDGTPSNNGTITEIPPAEQPPGNEVEDPNSTTKDSDGGDGDDGPNVLAIVLGVIFGFLACVGIALLVVFGVMRKPAAAAEEKQVDDPAEDGDEEKAVVEEEHAPAGDGDAVNSTFDQSVEDHDEGNGNENAAMPPVTPEGDEESNAGNLEVDFDDEGEAKVEAEQVQVEEDDLD